MSDVNRSILDSLPPEKRDTVLAAALAAVATSAPAVNGNLHPADSAAATTFDLTGLGNYPAEDGGVLDLWDAQRGGQWLYAAGFETWYRWTSTHWQPDPGGYTLAAELERLLNAWRRAATVHKNAATMKEETQKEEVQRWAAYVAAGRRTRARVASIEGMARARRVVAPDSLDAADVLNLANGTLDLNTLKLRPHDESDRLTYCLPYAYDLKATAPNWNVVVTRIEPETADFLQEYAGYALTPDTRYELAVWFYGQPGRGASTFLTGWQAMLGAKATLLGLADIERNRFALSTLPGKTLAIATEQPADFITTTNIINALISGDSVTVDRKFKDAIDITPRVKLAWAMNELPRVKGANDGIFRRVKVVTFPPIPEHERRPELKEAVKTEAAGILNWALEGLRRLRARGRFVIPAAVEEASRRFAENNDIPAAFVADQCYTGPEYKAQSQRLYDAYRNWCMATGHKPQSIITLANDWERLGFEKKEERAGNFWHGVGLKAEP